MAIVRLRLIALAITSFLSFSFANAQQPGIERAEPALDVTSMDRSVDPCVDFFAYSCGGWIKRNPIPPDQSSWDTYYKMQDENLGPLIATDMTRCIQCTRCVRFTEEIAGIQELGMIGRGEGMKVRVAIEQTVHHELSGNIIDLCPVGALVSKPYRFTARAWEMSSQPMVSPHDGVGTNLFGHVLRGKLMRVVPRENEEINETWIPDRDRFSYEGVYSDDRLLTPMLRSGWRICAG